MTGLERVVVVGAGQSDLQAACSLRDEKFAGEILLIGDESSLPYQRPPLSKGFIDGTPSPDSLFLKPAKFLEDRKIQLTTGRTVTAIDPIERQITVETRSFSYDHLVLATGTRARPLDVPGSDLDGVCMLRSVADATRFRKMLATARRLIVIGGGFIGLEIAAVASRRGVRTTVVDTAPRLMARAVCALVSDYYHDYHARKGVLFRYDTGVEQILGRSGSVTGIRLASGEQIKADLILVGIGVLPNTELAASARLEIDDGIIVDSALTTSDRNISAIGDCATFPNAGDGALRRIESVQNAVDQGRTVAAKLVGRPRLYDRIPWFWSDQGEAKLQIAGLTAGHDETLLYGEMEADTFSVFCFKDSKLVGAETVNRPGDHMAVRRLLQMGVKPTSRQIIGCHFDLKALERDLRPAV